MKKYDMCYFGIDFGTTNSLAAISVNRIASIATSTILSSAFCYQNHKLYSVKRLLGLSKKEIKKNFPKIPLSEEEEVKIRIGDKYFTPIDIAKTIFLSIKEDVKKHTNQNIQKAILTVPAYYDDRRKAVIKKSAEAADIEIVRLISEPTAAAYAYGLNKKNGTYLVFDLGGGTFDISLVKLQEGILRVMEVSGDNHLGGDDVDIAIAKHWGKSDLTLEAKIAKESLNRKNHLYQKGDLSLTYQELEELSKPYLDRAISLTKGIIGNKIVDYIILVGGATKSSILYDAVEKEISIPILRDVDPDKIVAYGAAIQAENLTQRRRDVIVDVLPLSIGIETYGGVMEKILYRNTPIPRIERQIFSTYADYQTGMKIHILQGEREMAKDNLSIGKFEMQNLSPKKAGLVKVEFSFAMDVDGLLSIYAKELGKETIGEEIQLEMVPSYGLSVTDADRALDEAMQNLDNDIQVKEMVELNIEKEKIMENLTKMIDSELLSMQEKKLIQESLRILDEANQEKLYDAIDAVKAKTSYITEKILTKIINKYIEI